MNLDLVYASPSKNYAAGGDGGDDVHASDSAKIVDASKNPILRN